MRITVVAPSVKDVDLFRLFDVLHRLVENEDDYSMFVGDMEVSFEV